MARIYRRVMRWCSTAAAVAATAWVMASVIAVGDGDGKGVEVPRFANAIGIVVVVCCTVVGAGAWLIERSQRITAEENIRPVVRGEIERALADSMPLVVATVVEALDRRLVPQMHDVAVDAGKQAAVRLREMVTTDLREIVADAHRRAVVTGQVMQVNAATGEAIGRGALRSIKQPFVSTSRED